MKSYGTFGQSHSIVGTPNLSKLSDGQLYGGIKKAWRSVNIHQKNNEPQQAMSMAEVAEAMGEEIEQRHGRNTIKTKGFKKLKSGRMVKKQTR